MTLFYGCLEGNKTYTFNAKRQYLFCCLVWVWHANTVSHPSNINQLPLKSINTDFCGCLGAPLPVWREKEKKWAEGQGEAWAWEVWGSLLLKPTGSTVFAFAQPAVTRDIPGLLWGRVSSYSGPICPLTLRPHRDFCQTLQFTELLLSEGSPADWPACLGDAFKSKWLEITVYLHLMDFLGSISCEILPTQASFIPGIEDLEKFNN